MNLGKAVSAGLRQSAQNTVLAEVRDLYEKNSGRVHWEEQPAHLYRHFAVSVVPSAQYDAFQPSFSPYPHPQTEKKADEAAALIRLQSRGEVWG